MHTVGPTARHAAPKMKAVTAFVPEKVFRQAGSYLRCGDRTCPASKRGNTRAGSETCVWNKRTIFRVYVTHPIQGAHGQNTRRRGGVDALSLDIEISVSVAYLKGANYRV